MEGLGAGAADLGEIGTFSYGSLSHADYEAIRLIENAEQLGSV